MKTIFLTRHEETENRESSLFKIYSRVERIVAEHYNVIRLKIGPWSKRDLDAWLIENTLHADLLITSDPYALKVLRNNGWRGKAIFEGLGGLPRGAVALRGAIPYLFHSDVVWFTCTSDIEIYTRLIAHDGTQPKAVCLPYGTDTQNYHPLKKGEQCQKYRNAWGFKPDDFVLLYAGRVTIEKNVQATIEAVAELIRLGYPVKLAIVGRFEDTPFSEFQIYPVDVAEKIKTLIEAHGISAHVTIQDWQTDDTLNEMLNAADAFINLTLHHDENFGLSQIEAMSTGIPVIGTAWGGLKDTILHNEVGFSIDSWVTTNGIRFDTPAVIDAVKCLIENKTLYTQQCQRARERSVDIYNLRRYAEHLTQLIKTTLDQPTYVTKPKLTSLGTRLQQRFARNGYPPRYIKSERPPTPVYENLSDPDYMELIAPYTSRIEYTLNTESRLFCAMTGHLKGDFFNSDDLLYSIRIPITTEEANVIDQLSRWRGVTRDTLAAPDELLISLIQKGMIGISKERK